MMRTPGIRGTSGKCPWKKSSLTVTFLMAVIRRPGSNADDRVDQPGGKPVAQAIEDRGDVDGMRLSGGTAHGYFFGGAGFGAAALAASKRRMTSAVRSSPGRPTRGRSRPG